ncbi:MAG: acyl-CoA thioesterase [Bacteroidales bacterium]|jgi:acyl-CoA thioester hydrolase|nr:acyl-CoA thioesterase [Bacteroidales bacterium]
MYISKKEIQVSYADTDMMGIIYHANYLKWFELGRTQLIEDVGYSYAEMEKSGYCAPVLKIEITYKKPIRYGERVMVETWIEENHGLKTTYGYHVVNGEGDLCAFGTTRHAVVRKDNFKPVQFMKYFPGWFQKYEEIKKK